MAERKGLEAWLPDNMDGPCKNGCCNGPYCVRTYREHGAMAAVAEAFPDAKATLQGKEDEEDGS